MKIGTRPSNFELSDDAERLVREGSKLAPRQSWRRATSWRALQARIAPEGRRPTPLPGKILWAGIGLGGATAVALLWAISRPVLPGVASHVPPRSAAWHEIELGPVGHLSLAPGARLRLPTPEPGPNDPYRVTLDEGQLCAQVNHRDPVHQGPFEVDAQGLQVTDLGTRFCVVAGSGPSWVSVEEGRVQVRGATAEAVLVSDGESLSADDPRLEEAPPPSPLPVFSAPTEVAPDRAPLVKRPAVSSGLSMENKLYEAGLRAREANAGGRALTIWEDYRRRFPQGVFAAEVDLLRLRELAAEGKGSLALAAAEEFPHAHPGHWRGSEAELIQADTLRVQLARPSEALPLYEHVATAERQTPLGERAFYGLCMSLHALSRDREAQDRARQYLLRFPAGAHRDELEHFVSKD